MTTGIIVLLAAWSLVIAIFGGIGLAARRWIRSKGISVESLFTDFWLGLALVIAFLQVWHIFAPVNWAPALIIAFIGGVGLFLNRTQIWGLIVRRSKSDFLLLLILLITAVWLANRSMAFRDDYDMGLYHLSSVRWISTYAIVPGLGNLYNNLAFNSSYFLFPAVVEIGPLNEKSHHIVNSLLLFMLLAQAFFFMTQSFFGRKRLGAYEILAVMFALPILSNYLVFAYSISNDMPVFAFGAIIGVLLCKMYFSDISHDETRSIAFSIIILSAVGITIKLNFAGLALPASLVGLYKLIFQSGQLIRSYSRSLIASMLIGAVAISIWSVRSVILSGYLAFPSTFGAFDVPWRIPEKTASLKAKYILSWARLPRTPYERVLGNWDWLAPWFRNQLKYEVLFVLPLVFFLLGVVIFLLRRKKDNIPITEFALFLTPPLVSMIFLFFTAPSIRFIGASIWWLGAGALAVSIQKIHRLNLLIAAYFVVCVIAFTQYTQENGIWVNSGPKDGFYPAPVARTFQFTTDSGLILHFPQARDGGMCWNAPLPCTPDFNKHLRLLEQGDLSSGFMISENGQ